MARSEVVNRAPMNARATTSRNCDTPAIREQSQPTLGFLQSAADFSIHDGSIASIGGDSFTARGDVHVTINHHYPSTESSPNENQQQGAEDLVPIRSESGLFSEDTFSLRPLPIQRSCDIYRRHLEAKGRGISLWIPEPSKNLPKQYQRNGIAIGDVGIITSSGSFHFLFNVCSPRGHPINPRRMPDGFEPLSSEVIQDFDISVQRELKENSYLASVSSVRVRRNGNSTGLVFESSEQDGAILTMPVGAKSEDLTNVARFRKYVTANMASWYKYAYHDRGFEIRNGDLRVVTGTDKTSAWGMATFSNSGAGSSRQDASSSMPGGEPKFHLEFGLIDNDDGSSNRQMRKYGWEYSGVAEVRAGPDPREVLELLGDDHETDDGLVYENQCLFIRTLNTTLPKRTWEQLGIDEEEVEPGYGDRYHSIDGGRPGGSFSSSRRGENANDKSGSNAGSSSSSTTHNRTAPASDWETGTPSLRRPLYVNSPSLALVDHPSNAINRFLLQNYSDNTSMAVTLDQDWISVLREDDCVLPSSEELLERIIDSYNIREEDGIIFLDAKYHSDTSNGSLTIAILCSEETQPEVQSEEFQRNGFLEDFDYDLLFDSDPNISNCASQLKTAYRMLQNVKIHQKKCRILWDRSQQLLQELQSLEVKPPDIVDEVDGVIIQLLRKAEVWSSWSAMKSFLRQDEVQKDIDKLVAGIDATLTKFLIQSTIGHKQSKCDDIKPIHQPTKQRGHRKLYVKNPVRKSRTEQHFEALNKRANNLRVLLEEYQKYADYLETLLDQCHQDPHRTVNFRASRPPESDGPESSSKSCLNNDFDSMDMSTEDGGATPLAVKILEGMHYLHTSDAVHRDLKAVNILTTNNGNVKLNDFGVSMNLRSMEREIKDRVGTPNWMAPELDQYYNSDIDWSRHLPSVPLDRKDHDRAMEHYFSFSSLCWRIDPTLFLRDMYQVLSVPPSQSAQQAPHYSPMLHNALIAYALGLLDERKLPDPNIRQHFAKMAKNFIEAECQHPSLTTVQALSILASFHCSQGEETLGYIYLGMSTRVAQALGLSTEDAELDLMFSAGTEYPLTAGKSGLEMRNAQNGPIPSSSLDQREFSVTCLREITMSWKSVGDISDSSQAFLCKHFPFLGNVFPNRAHPSSQSIGRGFPRQVIVLSSSSSPISTSTSGPLATPRRYLLKSLAELLCMLRGQKLPTEHGSRTGTAHTHESMPTIV